MFLSLAALLCLTSLTADMALAQRPTVDVSTGAAGRSPVIAHQVPARIPSEITLPDGTTQRMQFEGLNSTNYHSLPPYVAAPPNPDIAVGPTDVLVLANRTIARIRNLNNPVVTTQPGGTGVDPTWFEMIGLNGTNTTQNTPQTPISHRAMMDVWVGNPVLDRTCPSRAQGSPASCILDNMSVRYDQIHGRFLVLMTMIDLGSAASPRRKASWILVVSRYPGLGFLDIGKEDKNPFIKALPGGLNADNWLVWYGNDDTNGEKATNVLGGSAAPYGRDGFSGPYGNINAISTNADTVSGAAPYASVFDCRLSAIQAASQLATPSTFCYVPTGARLGYDNETVVITSPVLNANVGGCGAGCGDPVTSRGLLDEDSYPAYAGTRVRVIKKAALYIGKGTSSTAGAMIMGNSYYAGTPTAAVNAGHIYDLYTTTTASAANGSFGGSLATDVLLPNGSGLVVSPYTLHSEAGAPPDTLFWEPAELRGRAKAFYSTRVIPGLDSFWTARGGVSTRLDFVSAKAATYLVAARSIPYSYGAPTSYDPLIPRTPWNTRANKWLFIQPIRYITTDAIASFVPVLVGRGRYENYKTVEVEPYTDPANAPQKIAASTDPKNLLNVGDARPRRVILREGHLYIARMAAYFRENNFYPDSITGSRYLNNTVFYNVVQVQPGALSNQADATVPYHVLSAKWNNGVFFAPMFEVPANVFRYFPANPINVLPFLEKLFVGSTSSVGSFPGDPRFTNGPLAGCAPTGTNFSGGLGSTAGTSPIYASLYDMRCGQTHWNTPLQYHDPITGQLISGTAVLGPDFATWGNPNRWSTYAGGAIDPIDGSMWAYGPYSGSPLASTIGPSQWATYGANYKMSFPAQDDYGNLYPFVPGLGPTETNPAYFAAIEVLRRHGMLKWTIASTDPIKGAQLVEPPEPFSPDQTILRKEMARVVVLSLMDQADVDELIPNAKIADNNFESFYADVAKSDPYWKYIEILARLGVVKGCYTDDIAIWNFCPNDEFSRGEMAVVMVRAKMNNVFPTLMNGCPATTGCVGNLSPTGDNYGYFLPGNPNSNMTPHGQYFTDVPPTSGWYPFIQMLMGLRVTTGTGPGVFSLTTKIPRIQLAVFLARAFYY